MFAVNRKWQNQATQIQSPQISPTTRRRVLLPPQAQPPTINPQPPPKSRDRKEADYPTIPH